MASSTQFLEWHGQQWRVVMKVPVPLRHIVGKTKLKEPLHTADLKEANERKWEIVARMRADLKQARTILASNDPLAAEALRLRIQSNSQGNSLKEVIHKRADEVFASHGVSAAADFVEVASGGSTPLDYHADAFIAQKAIYGMSSQKDLRRVLKWLEQWRKDKHQAPFIEYLDRKTAGRFIDEYLSVGRSREKAAAYLSFLREYWKYLKQRGHVDENPWLDQDLPNAPRPGRDADRALVLKVIDLYRIPLCLSFQTQEDGERVPPPPQSLLALNFQASTPNVTSSCPIKGSHPTGLPRPAWPPVSSSMIPFLSCPVVSPARRRWSLMMDVEEGLEGEYAV